MKNKVYTAAALYRVSSSKQVKEDDSEPIPAQQVAIKRFCKEYPHQLVKEYFETGVSAFRNSAFSRDVIHEVMEDARNGLFEVLLVFKNSRLSRLESEYPLILKELHKYGVIVWEVNRNKRLTPLTHEESLTSYIDGWLAEGESRNISEQVKAGKIAKAYKGEINGGRPPFGLEIREWVTSKDAKGKVKPKAIWGVNEYEASILNIIANRIEEGKGGKLIAGELNKKGLLTRNNALWTSSYVRRVIKNPAIVGISLLKINTKPNETRRVHQYEHLYNPDYYVHKDEQGNYIINEDLCVIPLGRWLNIMEIIAKRKKSNGYKNPNRTTTFLLSSFLTCGYCGKSMIGISASEKYTKKDGSISIYDKSAYRCASKTLGNTCSGPSQINNRKLDKIFYTELNSFIEKFDPNSLLKDVKDNTEEEIALLKNEIQKLEREHKRTIIIRDKWLNELDEYFIRNGDYILSKENITRKINEQEEKISAIEKIISETNRKLDMKKSEKHNVKVLATTIPNWFTEFKNQNPEIQNQMLTHILDKVVYYRDKIEVYYKIDVETISNNKREPFEPHYYDMFKVISLD